MSMSMSMVPERSRRTELDIKKEGVIGFEWSKSQKPFFTHELRFKLFVAN
jgi:hypothetical protein